MSNYSLKSFLPPSLVAKDRAGPWLVLAVSVAVGALVAAVEVNDPKFRPGTSTMNKKKR